MKVAISIPDNLFHEAETVAEDLGLTQPEFAAHRGISVQALRQIESGRGNPTVETLDKIVAVFGLQVGFVPRRRGDAG